MRLQLLNNSSQTQCIYAHMIHLLSISVVQKFIYTSTPVILTTIISSQNVHTFMLTQDFVHFINAGCIYTCEHIFLTGFDNTQYMHRYY